MDYHSKQVVWAKVSGYPYWPAVIIDEVDCFAKKPDSKNPEQTPLAVRFLGEYNDAWVDKKYIFLYEENREKFCRKSILKPFQQGLKEADEHVQKQKEDPAYIIDITPKFIRENCNELNRKRSKQSQGQNKKIGFSKKCNNASENLNSNLTDAGNKPQNASNNLTIGVIGIGSIGEHVVRSLLSSGHLVNIWNRRYNKCVTLKKLLDKPEGITILLTPRAVLVSSDIVIMCLSCEEAISNIIDREFEAACNYAENVLEKKGVLVMSSLDPTTSSKLYEKITKKGGEYLEVSIQGNKSESANELMLLTAGNEELFDRCQPYFKAISRSSFYLGQTGYAIKLNLILQMMKGVTLGVLGEAMSLAARVGIRPQKFVEVLLNSSMKSPFLLDKSNVIIEKRFNDVQQPLKHMQSDLKRVLEMSDAVEHSIPLVSMANELYKSCKRLHYGSQDVAAVFLKYALE